MTNSSDNKSGSVGEMIGEFIDNTKMLLLPAVLFGLTMSMVLLGGIIGYFALADWDGGYLTVAICLVAVLLGALGTIAIFRKWPTLRVGDPDTPRTRRLSKATLALIFFAPLLPLILIQTQNEKVSAADLYSNAPLPMIPAVTVAILWLIGVPLLGHFTRTNTDELEQANFAFGERVGFQFFGAVAPVWWLGWRGGVLPQPDMMILFVMVLVASLIGNSWKRFS